VEYNLTLEGKQSQIVNMDLLNDVMYINSAGAGLEDKGFSICYNNRLKQFESFFSHEEIPFMVNAFGKFISIRNFDDTTQL